MALPVIRLHISSEGGGGGILCHGSRDHSEMLTNLLIWQSFPAIWTKKIIALGILIPLYPTFSFFKEQTARIIKAYFDVFYSSEEEKNVSLYEVH